MRDQGDAELLLRHFDQRQADAVHGNRALGHHLGRQLRRTLKPHRHPVAVRQAPADPSRAVDVSLDQMPAQAIAQPQRAFQVDTVARLQLAQVGPLQRLRPDLKPACFRVMRPPR